MTEDRAIISYAIIERTFDKAGNAKAQWLMIRAISEPALPKDWVPHCFMQSTLNPNKCAFPCKIDNFLDKSCKQCPYRKME